MAQVVQRGKGSFTVRVFLGRDPVSGKRRYFNKTIRGTKKQADAYATRLQYEVDTGTFRENSDSTVGEYLKEWLEHSAKRKVRPRTLAGYRDLVRTEILPVVGSIRLDGLTPSDVQRIVNRMEKAGKAPRTIRNAVGVLRNALMPAVTQGLVRINPALAENIELPKAVRRRLTVLDKEGARGFVEAAKEQRWGAVYIVLIGSGMRPSEALGLGWDDFDGKAVRIRRSIVRGRNGRDWTLQEPKTPHSRRTVPLPPFAIEALAEHRRRQAADRLQAGASWPDHGLIFVDEQGEPLRWRTMARREFSWILEEAGLPTIRPYDLRHTCASLLLSAGVNPKVVSERLGHSTVALTLDTYSSVLPGLQEEATAKLGEMFG
ncbi:MAG: site-specific integrase [Gemmatimonadales bacterium]|nr:MAG: site-specific integrase [Gemmatimonadales bacterium]